jgi:hypothetical protein
MNLVKNKNTDKKLRLIHQLLLIKRDIFTYFDNILSSMTDTRIVLRQDTIYIF